MLRILAVADQESHYLTYTLTQKKTAPPADVVCACGDLPTDYLEMLKIFVSEVLVLVKGDQDKPPLRPSLAAASLPPEDLVESFARAPGLNLHGKVRARCGAYFCGFNGVRADHGPGFRYREREMRRIVRRVLRTLRWRQRLDWWLGRSARPVIVISHAPPRLDPQRPDPAQGFDCFRRFIEKARPAVWLHGDVPLPAFNQVTRQDHCGTAIINAFEFKLVRVGSGEVEVAYRF